MQTEIATQAQTQLNLDTAPEVTCPESAPMEKDNTFNCSVVVDGQTIEVKVTQTDDQGNVTWEEVQPTP